MPVGDESATDELGIEPPAGPRAQLLAFLAGGPSWRRGLLGGGLLAAGAFFAAGAFLADLVAALAVFAVFVAAFLAADVVALVVLVAAFLADAAVFSAASRAALAPFAARSATSELAARPASAERLSRSATWLASFSRDDAVDLLQLFGHLVAHQFQDLLARLVPSLNQVVHPFLCLIALDVPGAHQLPDDLLGAGPCDLAQHRTGVQILLDAFVVHHITGVYLS